jgi:TetR/AcrR family transcriptional regulator, regulator of autoinduction and epiphytic fitness
VTVVPAEFGGLPADGRNRRRLRNREAAIDALIALLDEGDLNPSVAVVAERAGLSPRSLFRYFDDVADLTQEAVSRLTARVYPIVQEMALDPQLPLTDRIDAVARTMGRTYDMVRVPALVARSRAPFRPEMAAQIGTARTLVRALLEATFAPELDAVSDEQRLVLLAAMEVWCTFDTQHLLRTNQQVEGVDPIAVTAAGLTGVLGVLDGNRPA